MNLWSTYCSEVFVPLCIIILFCVIWDVLWNKQKTQIYFYFKHNLNTDNVSQIIFFTWQVIDLWPKLGYLRHRKNYCNHNHCDFITITCITNDCLMNTKVSTVGWTDGCMVVNSSYRSSHLCFSVLNLLTKH